MPYNKTHLFHQPRDRRKLYLSTCKEVLKGKEHRKSRKTLTYSQIQNQIFETHKTKLTDIIFLQNPEYYPHWDPMEIAAVQMACWIDMN
jgi:hypothetical protein